MNKSQAEPDYTYSSSVACQSQKRNTDDTDPAVQDLIGTRPDQWLESEPEVRSKYKQRQMVFKRFFPLLGLRNTLQNTHEWSEGVGLCKHGRWPTVIV